MVLHVLHLGYVEPFDRGDALRGGDEFARAEQCFVLPAPRDGEEVEQEWFRLHALGPLAA